jgi:hypothetical protein
MVGKTLLSLLVTLLVVVQFPMASAVAAQPAQQPAADSCTPGQFEPVVRNVTLLVDQPNATATSPASIQGVFSAASINECPTQVQLFFEYPDRLSLNLSNVSDVPGPNTTANTSLVVAPNETATVDVAVTGTQTGPADVRTDLVFFPVGNESQADRVENVTLRVNVVEATG